MGQRHLWGIWLLGLGCTMAPAPVVQAACPGGSADPAITPYLSAEVRGNNPTTRAVVDTLDDAWRTAAGLSQTGAIEPWFGAARPLGNSENNLFTYRLDGREIQVSVALVNMAPGSCSGTVNGGVGPEISDDNVLQDNAPRPVSLYDAALGTGSGHPGAWNETAGATGSPNGVLLTFSEPVRAFGAWFGDVESRTDGSGAAAYLRLLSGGQPVGSDIVIEPGQLIDRNGTVPVNQAACGSNATDRGCGNQATRWIGFVDSAGPRVDQVLVVVGDDDFGGDGGTEHLSFTGANIVAPMPNLLLVKRITAINGQTITGYTNEPQNPYDDNVITAADDTEGWPNPTVSLAGAIDGGPVLPNDEIEYTLYFLSDGAAAAEGVLVCDRIPDHTTFIPNAYRTQTPAPGGLPGANLGVTVLQAGVTTAHTAARDGDRAAYFPPGVEPASDGRFANIQCDGPNGNGAIAVDLGNIPPATSGPAYGYVKFQVRVR